MIEPMQILHMPAVRPTQSYALPASITPAQTLDINTIIQLMFHADDRCDGQDYGQYIYE